MKPHFKEKRNHKGFFNKGVAMVEFAIVLPLLIFILLIAIDFGRFGYSLVAVSNAARAAAAVCVYIPIDSCIAGNATVTASINTAIQNESGGFVNLGSIGSGVTVIYPIAEIPYLDVTVSHPFDTIFPWPGIPETVNLTRRAKTPAGLGAP